MVQRVNDPACLCGGAGSIPSLARWVKDPALLELWYGLQLWLSLNPWPGNFHMLWVQPEMKGREKKKKKAKKPHQDKEACFHRFFGFNFYLFILL